MTSDWQDPRDAMADTARDASMKAEDAARRASEAADLAQQAAIQARDVAMMAESVEPFEPGSVTDEVPTEQGGGGSTEDW